MTPHKNAIIPRRSPRDTQEQTQAGRHADMPTCRIMPNGRLAVSWFNSPRAVRTFGSRLDPVPISVLRMLRQLKKTPRCIVIAGPNGAGKTTFAREFLPRD